MNSTPIHNFHIPVMGLAFTIDTPVKVAKYGISSVVSIIQDALIEKMREYYSKEYKFPYKEISPSEPDYRAKRITRYLNLLNEIVSIQFQKVKNAPFTAGSDITKYFELLPETSPLKEVYNKMISITFPDIKSMLQDKLRAGIMPGAIDVNIMTKLDRINYSSKGEVLPEEYSDALSALRGFALSDVSSSIIFSAGLNPRLFAYTENFSDFYPAEDGTIKKKIIVKVSDYRSALIQGKFLAKKGLWVSEFRIESGLNCGGHAFATEGYLLGPILEEFKANRSKLVEELYSIFKKALVEKKKVLPLDPPPLKLSVQGGVGTVSEHDFLLRHYQFDSIGWGTPFLLVPEATQVDEQTLAKLAAAGKEDLYLSDSSPLGVRFNTLRNSSGQEEKRQRILSGRPGSPCIRKHLTFNTEFTYKPICTASRKYQSLKINELKAKELDPEAYNIEFEKIIEKECLCEGLSNSALINTNQVKKAQAVSICPGPNLAYFSKIASLREMVNHIYGKLNLLNTNSRPHVFVNELKLYFDYFQKEVKSLSQNFSEKQFKTLENFKANLLKGIQYYIQLSDDMKEENLDNKLKIKEQLMDFEIRIASINIPQMTATCPK